MLVAQFPAQPQEFQDGLVCLEDTAGAPHKCKSSWDLARRQSDLHNCGTNYKLWRRRVLRTRGADEQSENGCVSYSIDA